MMFSALLKKQMMESTAFLTQDRKRGKRRSTSGIVAYVLLYIVIFISFGNTFFLMASSLCQPLIQMGLDWLYFSMMGLICVFLGVVGSMFTSYATLYKARDNEFLLSMPIPPVQILTVRLLGIWIWSFVYEAVVMIPTLIVYWMSVQALTVWVACSGILLLILLSVFILTLSGVLGWVVAKISVRIKKKSAVIVVASLAFIALYYWGYAKLLSTLQNFLENAQSIGSGIRGWAYPLYLAGMAGLGRPYALLLTALLIVAVFAVVFRTLLRGFLKLTTTHEGSAKRAYKEQAVTCKRPEQALLRKEAKRFTCSANYMLNCGLSALLLPIVGVAALIFSQRIHQILSALPAISPALLACCSLCTLSSMNTVAAPSVSLEGRRLWLVQSLPVSPWAVLRAKLKFHLLLTEIPMSFCAICLMIVLKPTALGAISMLVLPGLYVLLSACFGLFWDLKMPNLTWTNEIIPIKQGLSVGFTLFGGWILIIVLSFVYFLLYNYISADVYSLLCTALLGIASTLLLFWLKTRGSCIFQNLQ